jgi:DNA polymerase-3 subunit gamma/tau
MLYNTYRPQRRQDLIGQHALTRFLETLTDSNLPGAILLTGGSGIGKTTVARLIATEVHCPHAADQGPCLECSVCLGIRDGSYFDVMEIDAASNGTADDVRRLVAQTTMSSMSGKRRIIILDEAHALSKTAWQALLKPIEENRTTTFIICTTEADKVPNTIKTRAVKFDLVKPARADLEQLAGRVAAAERKTIEPAALRKLTYLAGDSFRELLTLLEKVFSQGAHIDEVVLSDAGLMTEAESKLYVEVPRAVQPGMNKVQLAALFELVKALPSAEEPQRAFLGFLYAHTKKKALTSRLSAPRFLEGCSGVLGDVTVRPTKYTLEHLLWLLWADLGEK